MSEVFALRRLQHVTTGHELVAVRTPEGLFPVTDVLAATGTAGGDPSLAGLLSDWPASARRLCDAVEQGHTRALAPLDLAPWRLLAPAVPGASLYCAGANYRSHIEEMARAHGQRMDTDPRTSQERPWHFVKPVRSCVVPSGATVPRPGACQALDWEAELAVVIGKTARHVPIEQALEHVAGYTIANDLSARDLSRRGKVDPTSPFRFDWMAHKCFEGSNPLGPEIIPAHRVPQPGNLGLRLWVNQQLKQDANTSDMIFSIQEQIAHLSGLLTLHPGDVILTGTPAGVGMARKEFLQPGDTVSVEIDGLGRLETFIG